LIRKESVAFVLWTVGWPAPNFDSLQRECFLKLAMAAVDSAGNDMSTTATTKTNGRKHRPKASTVFAAAFLAGAAAAVGVNRAFDVHLAQSVPQVESEPIFVAIRSLPKGSPVTIYDVALREWPKAMLPSTALRANTIFDNMVLRHPLQEGQPILSLQLAQVSPEPAAQIAATVPASVEPERVVQSGPLTPAPAFVPYKAATPIPAPATNEQPQATVTPAAGSDLAKVEPTEAEPAAQMTPEPAAVAEAGTPEPETVAARVTHDTPNLTEATETGPIPSEPMEVATADPIPEPAPTVATTETSAEPAMGEPVPAEQVAQPTTASVAATVAAAEPTASPAEPMTEEPAAAPVAASVAEENGQPAEPTLASANKPTSVAPAVEPVDVTAAVLAEAAARQAEAANAAEEPATMVESPTPEAIAESTTSLSAEDKPAAAVSPTPASQQVMRYLVVPERIALQVDHSFTRPQPPAAVKPPAERPNQSQGVRRLPEAAATAERTRSNQSAATQRSNQSHTTRGSNRQPAEQLQAAAGKIPQAPSRQQPTSGIEQQAAADQYDANEPVLKSLFPKLSAGLTAMGQEWREFRDGTRQPASNEQRAAGPTKTSSSQRSAARPQQSR
jgi:hypothetical protein